MNPSSFLCAHCGTPVLALASCSATNSWMSNAVAIDPLGNTVADGQWSGEGEVVTAMGFILKVPAGTRMTIMHKECANIAGYSYHGAATPDPFLGVEYYDSMYRFHPPIDANDIENIKKRSIPWNTI